MRSVRKTTESCCLSERTHVVPSLSEMNCTTGLYYRLSYNCSVGCPIGCSTGCSISPWPAAPTGPGAESRYFLKGFWMEKRYLSQSRPLPAACVDRPRILKSILFKRILDTNDTYGGPWDFWDSPWTNLWINFWKDL